MTVKMMRVSPLSALVAAVVAAAGVVLFVVTKDGADHQNRRLLRDQSTQASLIATSTFDGYTSQIIGPLATAADLNPAALQPTAGAIAAAGSSAHLVVDVFRRSGGTFEAIAAAGPSQHLGALASGALAGALAKANAARTPPVAIFPQYVPTPVRSRGSNSTVGFAQATSADLDTVVYFQFTIDPFTYAAQLVKSGGPFESLRAVLYGSSRSDPSSIVVATTHELPLRGSLQRTSVPVGTGTWLLVTQARSPLAGSFANAAPWMILSLGLLLALVLGVVVEVLVRRQRYAARLVEQRSAELVEAHKALVLRERLSAVGEMATVIGHDLRNPLGAATNGAFLIRQRLGEHADPDLDRFLSMIEGAISRATTLAEDLMFYIRDREPEIVALELGAVLDEVLTSTPPPSGVEVTVVADAITLQAERAQLVRILANLITNAYQAIPQGGTLQIAASTNDGFDVITLHDSGEGFPQEVVDALFDPFITTRADCTGLGLAIVRQLVDAHHGIISTENAPTEGAIVTVRLPHATPATGPRGDRKV